MNKVVNVQSITKMMADFERENAKTEMMQEIMGDAIDDALGDADTEGEEDRIVSQVLDEIGVSFGEEIPDAPLALGTPGKMESAMAQPGKTAAAAGGGGGGDTALTDLEARLNNLRK
jgi:charged multivesicular body protein 2A